MLIDLLRSVESIYIAYGVTDFRKQISSLCGTIINSYGQNPYNKSAYIFCNKKRNSIKVLCYDKNGFILAQKTLLDKDKIKFQWPRNSEELAKITKEQLRWLLSGLSIYQKKSFGEIDIKETDIVN